jgi:hypothetical protein
MRDFKLKSEITCLANQMIENDKININHIMVIYGVVNIVSAFGNADEFMQIFKGYLPRTTHWRYKKRIEKRYNAVCNTMWLIKKPHSKQIGNEGV